MVIEDDGGKKNTRTPTQQTVDRAKYIIRRQKELVKFGQSIMFLQTYVVTSYGHFQ